MRNSSNTKSAEEKTTASTMRNLDAVFVSSSVRGCCATTPLAEVLVLDSGACGLDIASKLSATTTIGFSLSPPAWAALESGGLAPRSDPPAEVRPDPNHSGLRGWFPRCIRRLAPLSRALVQDWPQGRTARRREQPNLLAKVTPASPNSWPLETAIDAHLPIAGVGPSLLPSEGSFSFFWVRDYAPVRPRTEASM